MDYKLTKKDSFTVMGALKNFSYDEAKTAVPAFWQEHYEKGGGRYVCGMFGVNMDEDMSGSRFDYMIADLYDPIKEIPAGFVTKTIPPFTWAVFPCRGPMPGAMQGVNEKSSPSGCLPWATMNLPPDTALRCMKMQANIQKELPTKTTIRKSGFL